jgi:large subunit ribosomal protein L29
MIDKSIIKELTTDELVEKLNLEKSTYQQTLFNHAISPIENPIQLRYMRRNIARLLTELNKRNKVAN